MTLRKRHKDAMGKGSTYRGWMLVETGHRFYHACKGTIRICVGAARHGDMEELRRRFRKTVDDFYGGSK